jgi:hypothetical protein
MWLRSDEGLISPAVGSDIPEAYNLPRQVLPKVYLQNACIDAVRTSVIINLHSMTGRKIHGYLMNESFDIDTEKHLQQAAVHVSQLLTSPGKVALARPIGTNGHSTYCFDIDGIIASITPDNQYDLALPITENISLINSLYVQGHRILLFTARGSLTGINWQDITQQQMSVWGVKYHSLEFGKPAADYYVDDRLVSIEQLKFLLAQCS